MHSFGWRGQKKCYLAQKNLIKSHFAGLLTIDVHQFYTLTHTQIKGQMKEKQADCLLACWLLHLHICTTEYELGWFLL